MEFRLQPLGFMEFFQNSNHQAVKKANTHPQSDLVTTNTFIVYIIYTCVCVCVFDQIE